MSDFRLGDDVLLQVVENEVLLYDPRAKKVHLASPEVAEILRRLSSDHERHAQEFLSPREEELLAELEEKGLVVSETVDKTSRRGFLMSAGKSVAALAAVTTLALPEPAAANSETQLLIRSARYGADDTTDSRCGTPNSAPAPPGVFLDVTTEVQSAVSGTPGSITIAASNSNFTDPINGTVKELVTVHCCPGGPEVTTFTCENSSFVVIC